VIIVGEIGLHRARDTLAAWALELGFSIESRATFDDLLTVIRQQILAERAYYQSDASTGFRRVRALFDSTVARKAPPPELP
jgi:hypothetical protein